MNKINDFTEGKILSPLIRFAIPILLSQLLQTAYDIGRNTGERVLADVRAFLAKD